MIRAVTELDLDRGLARLGYQTFRPGQREAIEALLDFGRLLLVAPTGGGKSLTYQLPASLLPGTTLVISPLVSLMHDQVQALEARGVPATFLAATLVGRGDARAPLASAAGALQARLRRARAARLPGLPRARARARRARSSRWTRRTASASGVTTSGPSTCRSAALLAELKPRLRAGLHRDRDAGRPRRDPGAARARRRHAAAAAAASRGRTSRLRARLVSSERDRRPRGGRAARRGARRAGSRPRHRDRLRADAPRHRGAGRAARRVRLAGRAAITRG